MTLHTFARGKSTQLKLDVRSMKMNFSFKVIFFISGSDLSNSFEAFLVLCFISLLFLYEKYRVAQALQVPRLADPKFSNTDLSLTQP